MATKPIKLEIDLKDRDAKRKLQGLAKDVQGLDGDMDDVESAGKAMARAIEQSADDMIAEIDATARAVEALDRHLDGTDMDPREVVADLKRIGLTAEDVEQDAEELAAALRRSGDVKVHAAERGFDDLGQAVDSVRADSDRAASASRGFLGGMVGDSAAAVTGIGPLGEAISQITEGLAEGEIGFQQLGPTLATMGGIAAAAWAVNEALSVGRDRAKRIEERTEAWVEALEDGQSVLEAMNEIVRDQETWGDEQIALFEEMGLTAEDVIGILEAGTPAIEAHAQAWIDGADGPGEMGDRMVEARNFARVLTEELEGQTAAVQRNEQWTKFAGEAQDDAAQATEDHTAAVEAAEEALRAEEEALRDSAEALEDQAEARFDFADATYALEDAVRDQEEAVRESIDAMDDAEASDEDRAESLRKVREAATDVAEAEVAKAEAEARSRGATLSARQELDLYNGSLIRQASQLKGPQRQAILDHTALVNGIPSDVVTDISAALDRGDVAEANRLLNNASRSRSATINAEANLSAADRKLQEWISRRRNLVVGIQANPRGSWGAYASGTPYSAGGTALVGEEGPELVDLPMGSKVTPTRRTDVADSGSGGGTTTVRIIQNFPAGTRPIDVARAQRRYDRIQGAV